MSADDKELSGSLPGTKKPVPAVTVNDDIRELIAGSTERKADVAWRAAKCPGTLHDWRMEWFKQKVNKTPETSDG